MTPFVEVVVGCGCYMLGYVVGCVAFFIDAKHQARRANKAERERDEARQERDEFWRDLLHSGDLHFHDGPISVILASSQADAIERVTRPTPRNTAL